MVSGKPKVAKTKNGALVIDVSVGTESQKRDSVERYVPRQQGLITFFKSGKPTEKIYTTDMKQIAFERFCGYGRPVWDYTEKIIVDAGTHQGMELVYPQNQIYNPW